MRGGVFVFILPPPLWMKAAASHPYSLHFTLTGHISEPLLTSMLRTPPPATTNIKSTQKGSLSLAHTHEAGYTVKMISKTVDLGLTYRFRKELLL